MKTKVKHPSYAPKQIAKIRRGLAMSQEAFGVLFDVSRQTVNAWESGKHPISPLRATQIESRLKAHLASKASQ